MKLLIFEIIFMLLAIGNAIAQGDRKVESKLAPHYSKLQYAGSMGLVSAGLGWSYGKGDKWETDFMIGYIPKYTTDRAKMCITIKENYIPWKIQFKKTDFYIAPLTSGFYVSSISGKEFWVKEPNKYPKSYYGFSTKVRFNMSVGQRIIYKTPESTIKKLKSVSAFYEVSSSDLYIISAIGNSNLKPTDYLHLSLGLALSWK